MQVDTNVRPRSKHVMGIAIFIAFLAVYIGISVVYGNWLEKGFRPRRVDTALRPEQVRDVFGTKVAKLGWSLVDDDNPIVAQSGLMAGRRQQISVRIESHDGNRTRAVISVPRFWRKRGMPYKAHTLRMRMNGFLTAVTAADPTAKIEG